MLSKEEILNESLEVVLTKHPELEDPLIKCKDDFEKLNINVSSAAFRAKFVEAVISECKEEFLAIAPSGDQSKEVSAAILSEFMTSGIDLFTPDEQATYFL